MVRVFFTVCTVLTSHFHLLTRSRYVGHLLGCDLSKAGYVWAKGSDIIHVACSSCTLFVAHTCDTAAAISCLQKVHMIRSKFFQPNFAVRVMSRYQFPYMVTESCGIDFAVLIICKNYAFGRFGVFLWMLICRLFFSMSKVVGFTASTSGGLGDNFALEACANQIFPNFFDYDKDIFDAVGIKSEHFMSRKQVRISNFNE